MPKESQINEYSDLFRILEHLLQLVEGVPRMPFLILHSYLEPAVPFFSKLQNDEL